MEKGKRREFRKREGWVYIQFRIKAHQRLELKKLCFELDLTIQDFMEKLLLAKLPKAPEPTNDKEVNG